MKVLRFCLSALFMFILACKIKSPDAHEIWSRIEENYAIYHEASDPLVRLHALNEALAQMNEWAATEAVSRRTFANTACLAYLRRGVLYFGMGDMDGFEENLVLAEKLNKDYGIEMFGGIDLAAPKNSSSIVGFVRLVDEDFSKAAK